MRANRTKYPDTNYKTPLNAQQEDSKRLQELHEKVRLLKDVTIEIGHRVNEDNRILDGMAGSFENVKGMFSVAMGKIKRLSKRDGNFLCYTLLFCLLVFLFLYWRF